jgi:hypothetical protein
MKVQVGFVVNEACSFVCDEMMRVIHGSDLPCVCLLCIGDHPDNPCAVEGLG